MKHPSIERLSIDDLSVMDRDLIKKVAQSWDFSRIAVYRIRDNEATLTFDTADPTDAQWPANFTCDHLYYTQKNKQHLTFGWQTIPIHHRGGFTSKQATAKLYLPPQGPWGTKLLFVAQKTGRFRTETGLLDGFLEALARRIHFWQANDELRHFIDDVTSVEQLNSFNTMLSRVLSHEIRNPIMNLISLIHTYRELPPESKNEHEYLMKELDHFSKIILQVIQKFEVVTGSLTSDKDHPAEVSQVLDLQKILEAVCDQSVKNNTAYEGTHLNLALTGPRFLTIGIPSFFNLAIKEVINNAFYYANGTTVHVSLYHNGHNIILDIADDGVPIAAGQEELIFMRYYQAPKTNIRKSGYQRGLGLGLYVARHVTEMMGGQLLFVRGVGSKGTFRFIFSEASQISKAS